MAPGERSFSEVVQDIIGSIQEIVRAEVRLAKTEIQEGVEKAKSSLLLMGAGAVTALFAVLFLLQMIVNALALVMPNWAAALIVGVGLAAIAGVLLSKGMSLFKRIHATPERTVQTIKETAEWAKQQTK